MRIAITFLLATLIAPAAQAQVRPLPFDSGWTLDKTGVTVTTFDKRQVLQVETGFAHRGDVKMMDGTIDFDVQLTRRRSFVYLNFRVAGEGEHEEFYLRPHKSQLPDAVQYAPVWQGASAWQLHHGPGGTAAVGFEAGSWTHIRVVMQGQRAALFINDMATPALLVPKLAREPQAGHIALGGFLPANTPGDGPIARFANVEIRPDVTFDLAAAVAKMSAGTAAPTSAAGSFTVIRSWSVSRSFVPKDEDVPALPAANVTGEFQRLDTEEDGLLELHRHVKLPQPESRGAAAVARVNLRAAQAGTYGLDLGFSDIATVFVNGTPIFRGDDSYSYDRRRDGLIAFDQARIYLPLRAGDNDLAIVLSDSFGGWGLMGRLVGAPGLSVAAR